MRHSSACRYSVLPFCRLHRLCALLPVSPVHGHGDQSQLACATCSGTKREKYLTENVKAFHVKLTSEDKAALEAILHQDKVTPYFHLGRPVHLLGAVQDKCRCMASGVGQALTCHHPPANSAGRHLALGQRDCASVRPLSGLHCGFALCCVSCRALHCGHELCCVSCRALHCGCALCAVPPAELCTAAVRSALWLLQSSVLRLCALHCGSGGIPQSSGLCLLQSFGCQSSL